MDDSGLLAGPGSEPKEERIDLTPIRQAIRAERKLILQYADAKGERSRRTVWPIVLGFFDRSRVLAAWCELRQDYRHFRTDRIIGLRLTDKRYPRRRRALMKEWREIEGIPEAMASSTTRPPFLSAARIVCRRSPPSASRRVSAPIRWTWATAFARFAATWTIRGGAGRDPAAAGAAGAHARKAQWGLSVQVRLARDHEIRFRHDLGRDGREAVTKHRLVGRRPRGSSTGASPI